MSKQLHKNFVDEQVKLLLKSYMDREIKINYILQILGIKRSRFFELLTRYRKDPDNFSIQFNLVMLFPNKAEYRTGKSLFQCSPS